jgi:SAM-dependent methyltransferase
MAKALRGASWRRRVREDWNVFARSWERWENQHLHALASVDPALFRALAIAPGQRVLDVGCGSGDPALAIAQTVGPRGAVIGIDVAGPMLAIARRRAAVRGIRNARFRRGDLASFRWTGPRVDRVVSRYGIMFVEDIPAALARLRAALKPGGRIALAVWGPVERNPYFSGRIEAALPFLREPPPDPESTPHPLRLGREGLLARMLRRAGFRGVRAEGVRTEFMFHHEDERFEMAIDGTGPFGALHARLSRAQQRALRDRLARRTRRFRDGGVIRCPSFSWVVSGRR